METIALIVIGLLLVFALFGCLMLAIDPLLGDKNYYRIKDKSDE